MDGELYLRLLVEDAVAHADDTTHELLRRLDVIRVAGRALAAVGAVADDLAARIPGECELALALRGADWLPFALADLPPLAELLDASRRATTLESVVAAAGATLEAWTDAVRVRTPGHVMTTPGALVPGPDVISVSTGGRIHAFDTSRAVRVVEVAASVRPVDVATMAAAWGPGRAIAAYALHRCGLLDEEPADDVVLDPPDEPAIARDRFEVVARRAVVSEPDMTVTITSIQDASIVHARVDGAAVHASWLTSHEGVHRQATDDPFTYLPRVPPPPAPLRLALVSAGRLVEVPLR